MDQASGGYASSNTAGTNPWGDGEVHVSSYRGVEQLRRSMGSSAARSTRSSSRSSRSSASLRRMDAAAEAAALRAQLLHMETETKIRLDIEHKKAKLDRVRVQRELKMADARLQVISELEAESFDDSLVLDLPTSDGDDYVRDYIRQLPSDTEQPRSVPNPVIIPSATPAGPSSFMDSSIPDMSPAGPVPQKLMTSNGTSPSLPFCDDTADRVVSSVMPKLSHHTSPQCTSAQSAPVNETTWTGSDQMNCSQPTLTQDVTGPLQDLASAFAEQVNISRLLAPEPEVFTGNPLEFPKWLAAFETLIERKAFRPAEKMYNLQKYLDGDAKDAVEGYFMLDSSEAYMDAKNVLKGRFGNQYIVAKAFRDKLNDWKRVPARDGFSLRKFSDFLRLCEIAMETNQGLKVLNDCNENRKLAAKLPDWLVHRWGRVVHDHKEARGEFPPFKQFVKFVCREADIACEPSLSDLSESKVMKNQQKSTRALNTGVKTVTQSCPFCNADHKVTQCEQLLAKPVQDRKTFVKTEGLCFGCLQSGHRSKECKRRLECHVCHKKHPTLLHGDLRDKKDDPSKPLPTGSFHTTHHSSDQCNKSSMIVPVWVSDCARPDKEQLMYALLDTQSDTTFILDSSCDSLGVDGPNVNLLLSTMSAKDQLVNSRRITGLQVRGYNSKLNIPLPTAYCRQLMPANRSHIPTPAMARKWSHLKGIQDKLMPLKNCEVGLLIGYNCSRALAPREVVLPPEDSGGPFDQRMDLGWGIVGVIDYNEVDETCGDDIRVSHRILTCEFPQQQSLMQVCCRTSIKETILPQQVTRMMELDFSEKSTDQRALSNEDKKFMTLMEDGIHKREDHYEMPLPFKVKNVRLPNNRKQPLNRLSQLKGRLLRQPKLKEDYTSFMQRIIDNDHAELVPPDQLENTDVWYVPHHGVYHAKKADKLRVVFDCSARSGGVSLNDLLLQGPDLTNALTGVLCRFRQEPVAVICDVEQMFFQFYVSEEHRDFLRFFWWKNGDSETDPLEYRMKVYLFGAASSPGCANFGLKRVADDNETICGAAAADFIRKSFYVDDGLTSVQSAKEAIDLVNSTQEMCRRGGLRLHKFISNSKEVMTAIQPTDRAQAIKDLDMLKDDLPVERALGVQWCIELDTFQFRITLQDQPLTRHGILSTVSSIYDPLGFLAPVLLVGKKILQEMCRQGSDWDSPITDTLRTQWEKWRSTLFQLEGLKIPRCFKPEKFGAIKSVELHHFSDASNEGYGQCSYLRLVDKTARVHCGLVMGKARVTPLKAVTIPRLELTAAVVSVRISDLLKRELTLWNGIEEVFWTDSRVVLGYIRNDTRRFHTFVANMVQKIRDFSDPAQWRYVKTDENPADDASRGISPYDLVHTSKWLTGPDFLWRPQLPDNEAVDPSLNEDDPEVKRTAPLATTVNKFPQHFELERLEYFSDWNRAKRAIANCTKFKDLLKNRVRRKTSTNDTTHYAARYRYTLLPT